MIFDDFVTFIGFKELICPECLDKLDEAYKTKILETRTYFCDELNQPIVRRRHICTNCDTQFYTIESQEH
jgi:transcriptional regulator NrdR family protein